MRDRQLDIYRALLMMYIPCVVHTAYWLADGREPLLSVILVEMPLVFFIAGASLSVSRSHRSLLPTIIGRFKRVVVPYYVYACVLLAVGLIASWVMTLSGQASLLDLSQYGWRDIASILLARDIPQMPFIWHLWFIPCYLILSCTFPLQVKLMSRSNRWAYLAGCLTLFLMAQALTGSSLLRQGLAYNIFMVAGYLLYRKVKVGTIALTGAVSLAAVLVYVFVLGGNFCPMQARKFPPDWLFVVYNLFVLCLLSLVFSHISMKDNGIFRLWSQRGYNIYLYQSVVFAAVYFLRQHVTLHGSWLSIRPLLDAIIVLVLSTGLSLVTYPIERFVIHIFDSSKKEI